MNQNLEKTKYYLFSLRIKYDSVLKAKHIYESLKTTVHLELGERIKDFNITLNNDVLELNAVCKDLNAYRIVANSVFRYLKSCEDAYGL